MLDTLEEDLTPELIKHLHYELKSGVFEDRTNGYAIGDYKKRSNMVGMPWHAFILYDKIIQRNLKGGLSKRGTKKIRNWRNII